MSNFQSLKTWWSSWGLPAYFSYIPKLPILSLLTMPQWMHGRQWMTVEDKIGYLFFIHLKSTLQGGIRDRPSRTLQYGAGESRHLSMTLGIVNLHSLCGNCYSKWCYEGFDPSREFGARIWRMSRSGVNSARRGGRRSRHYTCSKALWWDCAWYVWGTEVRLMGL